MYCKECGTLISSSSKFCQNCGTKIMDELPISKNSSEESRDEQVFTLSKFLKNVKIRFYLLYVAINMSLLLIFSDNIMGAKYRNDNIFWPFGGLSLGYYDISELFFYTIILPSIFYLCRSQIKYYVDMLKNRISLIKKSDSQNLMKIFFHSLLTSFFLMLFNTRNSDFGLEYYLSFSVVVLIGCFFWMLLVGLFALAWNLIKIRFQRLKGKNHPFIFSDYLNTWKDCGIILGPVIVVANIFSKI